MNLINKYLERENELTEANTAGEDVAAVQIRNAKADFVILNRKLDERIKMLTKAKVRSDALKDTLKKFQMWNKTIEKWINTKDILGV